MKNTFLLLFGLLLFSCQNADDSDSPETNGDSNYIVEFEGKDVNLEPFFEGFPYQNFNASYKAGKFFYYHQDSTTMLKMTDIENPDLQSGELISDIDYSMRNVWATRYNENDNCLYWMGDEVNDEKIDLFKLDLKSHELKKLTDVPYIFGWNFNEEKTKIAYVVRLGNLENRLGELRILDLETGESETILQDTEKFRFTWGSPTWSPDGNHLATPVLKGTNRTYANIMLINLETAEGEVVTDVEKPRSFPGLLNQWVDKGNKFIYSSDEGGYTNLYTYDVEANKNQKLTDFSEDLGGAEFIEIDNEDYLAVITTNPVENTLHLIDPVNGKVLKSKKYPYNIGIIDSDENKLMVQLQSNTTKFRIDELTLTKDKFSEEIILDLPEELKDKIVRAEVEKIEYPTFDIDTSTGETRMIHAFLYKPKNPLPKEQQRVMIQSFYGGRNAYSVREHILAAAGIYVLSPSPRGSSGFGKEFSSLNDKDLGGNEIIDIIYAGKYISEKLGIPPERIGVFGGSHGGYATMRLLTFPGEINGIEEDFDWGFGISHAGFSDIIHFYEHCNIPDWVTLEAGDPETEAEKLKNRSPLYHADEMTGSLLLTHGENDSRVPIEGSQFMNDSLKKYDKDVIFQKYEGMGHHIKGLENNVRQYKTWFEFIENANK